MRAADKPGVYAGVIKISNNYIEENDRELYTETL